MFYRTTNSDGRCTDLFAPANPGESAPKLRPGLYKIVFHPKAYFEVTNRKCFYPWVEVCDNLAILYIILILAIKDHFRNREAGRALPHSSSNQSLFLYHVPRKLNCSDATVSLAKQSRLYSHNKSTYYSIT